MDVDNAFRVGVCVCVYVFLCVCVFVCTFMVKCSRTAGIKVGEGVWRGM